MDNHTGAAIDQHFADQILRIIERGRTLQKLPAQRHTRRAIAITQRLQIAAARLPRKKIMQREIVQHQQTGILPHRLSHKIVRGTIAHLIHDEIESAGRCRKIVDRAGAPPHTRLARAGPIGIHRNFVIGRCGQIRQQVATVIGHTAVRRGLYSLTAKWPLRVALDQQMRINQQLAQRLREHEMWLAHYQSQLRDYENQLREYEAQLRDYDERLIDQDHDLTHLSRVTAEVELRQRHLTHSQVSP